MKTEKRLKQQSDFFVYEVKDLREVAKERHLLFFEAVKRVQEDVNMMLEEIHFELGKEVMNLDQSYSALNTKVDIAATDMKVAEFHNSLLTKIDTMSELDSKSFAKLEELVGSLQELLSKLGSSTQSSFSQDSLSKMFSTLESSLKADLAPLFKFVDVMPSEAPHIKTGVQGG